MNETTEETRPKPLVQINCYHHLITLSRIEDNGSVSTYPIRLQDLAMHLNNISLNSGFLPKDILAWGRQGDDEYIVWYTPRRVYDVTVIGRRGPKQLRIPLPAAVLVGSGTQYDVFAVKRRPRNENAKLYRFPSPNAAGGVCRGSVKFPVANAQTMPAAWRVFMESGFNDHNVTARCHGNPNNVLILWRKLHKRKAKTFPNIELVSADMRLSQVLPD